MRPNGWHTVTPRLVGDDPARLVAFLVETFGAQGELQGDKPAEIRIGDSLIMVSSTSARAATASLLYVYVDDADATYARALAAGATIVDEPCDTPWGDRRAIVTEEARHGFRDQLVFVRRPYARLGWRCPLCFRRRRPRKARPLRRLPVEPRRFGDGLPCLRL